MKAELAATIGDCVDHARRFLPRLEADILACHALGVSRSDLYGFPERQVAAGPRRRVADWVARRASGEPVAYILGKREFWGLELEVTPVALAPRPDTETLVEAALPHIAPTARVLDIGTGCGAVALAIASERPGARVFATDIDPACVELCRRNGRRLGLAVDVACADLFEGTEGRFDVVVSNPPYVATDAAHLAAGDLRFEPRKALVGGSDGLRTLARLISQAPDHLSDHGWLCVEHGHDQRTAVHDLFATAGFGAIGCHRDLADRPRATVGHWRPAP